MVPKEIIQVEDILKIHSVFSNTTNQNYNFNIETYSRDDRIKADSSRIYIYILINNSNPVYVGKSFNASTRTKDHKDGKIFDSILLLSAEDKDVNKNVLKYIEFLIYYSLWSKGFALIYNALSVWNTLPISGQSIKTHKLFSHTDVAFAHSFVNNFLLNLKNFNFREVTQFSDIVKLSYNGTQNILLNAIYWRPTIIKELHDIAISYWANRKNSSFAGSGASSLLKGSSGKRMKNINDDQYLSYKTLKSLNVIVENGECTSINHNYPFPRTNLMMHMLFGLNSVNARRELSFINTNKIIQDIEFDWISNPVL